MQREDLPEVVDELGEAVALVKAHVVGGDVAASNVVPAGDDAGVFRMAGAIEPPYDPATLCRLFELSNSLRQNIDAYATNIDGFGHRFEPILDLDAGDADARIRDALALEREHHDGGQDAITDEEVATRRREIAAAMRREKWRIEAFFDACCAEASFVTQRRRTRQDLELLGNAYWEVLRNGDGEIAQFVYVPAFTVRLLPLDRELVEVDQTIRISELTVETIRVRRRFRRFVQVVDAQVVFFRELGDPRIVSRKTGRSFPSLEALRQADADDGPATELLHFKIHSPNSPYGVPRWIGNLLSVLGSRQAEEVNLLYFSSKTVPPLAILVSGGRLSQQSVPRIEKFLEEHLKGKANWHKCLVLEAEPAGGASAESSGRLRIELKPLTTAQYTDGIWTKYDERNQDKVGQAFRLPRLLRGDIRDFNRSCYSADTETLTEDGWKLHHEIAPDERIAVYDPSRAELRFEVPIGKHVATVRENLLRFTSKSQDILVTADHKMLFRPPDVERWRVSTAAELAQRHAFEFLCAPSNDDSGVDLEHVRLPRFCQRRCKHTHEPIPGDLWLEFLGYYVSEGCVLRSKHIPNRYAVIVSQKDPLYLGRIRRVIEALGWSYSSDVGRTGTTSLTISHLCLRKWLAEHCGKGSDEKRLPWSYVTGLPRRQLAILHRALMDGDGARSRDLCSGTYSTVSRVLAGQMQAICMRLGMRATVRWQEQARIFRVYHTEHPRARVKGARVETVPYEGEVYCFSCPGAGFFVTRRNGKVAIQGNTAEAAIHLAESQVFDPERQEFDSIINRRILGDLGIRFWRFVSKSPVNRDPATWAEIVRGLVNANVLTPEEARDLTGEVFNKDLKRIADAWVRQPVALTLAGLGAGGAEPAAKRAVSAVDVEAEVGRLLAVREALRRAAEGEDARTIAQPGASAAEREVVRVPAEEMASWFEPEGGRAS
jgi:PBSX family phage portal protein